MKETVAIILVAAAILVATVIGEKARSDKLLAACQAQTQTQESTK